MEKLLVDKVAIITGGTRGIGKAIALKFALNGCSLAIFGTNKERGEQVLQEIKALLSEKQKAVFYCVDVSKADQVEESMKNVLETFGKLDILVNNAGITKDNLLMKLPSEEWASVIETNLSSVFYTCKVAIRPMMKLRQGKIINVTSVVGLMGNAGQTNYAAAKAGMIGFTKSLAKEVGSRNICVNCIAPGYIETDMTHDFTEVQKENFLKQVPLGRVGGAEEVASAALFLASPHSNYISGHTLTVDGGMAAY